MCTLLHLLHYHIMTIPLRYVQCRVYLYSHVIVQCFIERVWYPGIPSSFRPQFLLTLLPFPPEWHQVPHLQLPWRPRFRVKHIIFRDVCTSQNFSGEYGVNVVHSCCVGKFQPLFCVVHTLCVSVIAQRLHSIKKIPQTSHGKRVYHGVPPTPTFLYVDIHRQVRYYNQRGVYIVESMNLSGTNQSVRYTICSPSG